MQAINAMYTTFRDCQLPKVQMLTMCTPVVSFALMSFHSYIEDKIKAEDVPRPDRGVNEKKYAFYAKAGKFLKTAKMGFLVQLITYTALLVFVKNPVGRNVIYVGLGLAGVGFANAMSPRRNASVKEHLEEVAEWNKKLRELAFSGYTFRIAR